MPIILNARAWVRLTRKKCPFIATAVLLGLGACDDGTRYTTELPLCPETVSLTVDSTDPPEFSWEPACRVWSLQVVDAETGDLMWHVGIDDESLRTPVTYGVVPTGAGDLAGPEALVPGRTYIAVLTQRSEGGRVLATMPFTP
jgi:hypothetical protein